MKQLDYKSIARPYAKAAFKFAVEQNQLSEWADMLQNVAMIAADSRVNQLMKTPNVTSEKILELFYLVMGDNLNQQEKNFLHLLAIHNRLMVLPEIVKFFDLLRSDKERLMNVKFTTAMPLTAQQEEKVKAALHKRLQYDIQLETEIDENILGGAIIRARDLVIDGSGRTKLTRLVDYIKGNVL